MTFLANEQADFADEALAGFVAAHPQHVRAVHGGVVRATASPRDQVAVVVGGGSGHYPAFAGWVGAGFAHGAPCGNIFASPSAIQVRDVARAADNGAGVILGYGNYVGDVLHFGQAAEMLRAEGIEAHTLAVTDDIASAEPQSWQTRRGIAGDLPVFKIAAAAAEAGLPLEQVLAIGERANAATKSFGVAFTGCTLPGADQPLFAVPEGKVGIGIGIHGEPGIDEIDLGTADELADRLVDGLLAEIEHDGVRVLAIVNGLGATKYEELFVAYRRVSERLARAQVDVAYAEVGELVTSLDMAGVSLTLTVLDDELERLWTAPCDAPAFRRGAIEQRVIRADDLASSAAAEIEAGSEESQAAAQRVLFALQAARGVIDAETDRLGELDAVAGDGDHGIGMSRGIHAAVGAAERAVHAGGGAKSALLAAAEAWSERAGGTSGALWGAMLVASARVLGNETAPGVATALQATTEAIDAVQRLGGAQLGDKTLVDAAVPFQQALVQASGNLAENWAAAAAAATEAAQATAEISARAGRARVHGAKSIGTPDPGAVSLALIATAVGQALSDG